MWVTDHASTAATVRTDEQHHDISTMDPSPIGDDIKEW